VNDSTPEGEFQETVNKSMAMVENFSRAWIDAAGFPSNPDCLDFRLQVSGLSGNLWAWHSAGTSKRLEKPLLPQTFFVARAA
jgi:hypothetical protein